MRNPANSWLAAQHGSVADLLLLEFVHVWPTELQQCPVPLLLQTLALPGQSLFSCTADRCQSQP